jgi:signal transduction histidine kinase/DNA-binding response OmpR family regulator
MNAQVKEHFIETYGLSKTVDFLFDVLDALPVSFFIKNDKLQMIFANKANLELTERSAQDSLGYTDFDVHTRENAEIFSREDRAVFAGGKIRRNEEFKTRKDGTVNYFLTYKGRFDINETTSLLVGTNTVIDDLKKREIELAEATVAAQAARQDLQEVLDAMPLGITLLDSDLNVNFVNDETRKFWNIPHDQNLVGTPFIETIKANRLTRLDVTDADWQSHIEGRIAEIRAGAITPREVPGPDGKTFLYSCSPLSGGKRLVSFHDATEQKNTRLEAERAGQKASSDFADMKATMDAMRMGVTLVDKDLNIIFTNKANYKIWNLDPSQGIYGKPFRKLIDLNRHNGLHNVSDDEWETYLTSRMAEIAAGDIAPREFARPDGVTMIYSCTSLSDGKRLVCYFDISEQKKAEQIFKDAEQKAILADRAKSEFLANMSHEIRTPMNGVLGMAELLARTELNSKQKTFTDIIVKSGNALLTIINDILDFSKIDAGQLALDPAPFRLAEAIEDVATLVSARAQEKDLELIVRIEPGLPENVVGDVGRIRQIVTNLMGNAVKFTEHGHVLVDVTGQVDTSTGTVNLLFKITDTGVGIPAEKLKLVFEKFSQVDASSTRRHEGTGLGLAISTKLVALMGGEIGADSETGKGSTFWFKVNLPVKGNVAKKKILPFDVAGSRVLIVDDNPVNRSILLEQMCSWSFDACAATGGREGLAVLSQAKSIGFNVDAVILDYHMPELNGADVARLVRQNPDLATIPIILLTSVDTAMQGAEFEDIHIDAHLMKPARSSILFDTIVGVIREARSNAHHQQQHEKTKTPNEQIYQAITPVNEVPAPVIQEPVMIAHKPSFAEAFAGNQQLLEPSLPEAISKPSIDILVAEDNAVNQIVFTQILESLPYSFEIVDNGRKALEAMQIKAPALILMDVSMPEMNGLEATQAIRKHETATGKHHTPIVGVTAHALKGDRERCIEAGMDDYMSKPISPDMLSAKIESHMAKIKAAKSA